MGYTLRIKNHLSEEEIEVKIKQLKGFWQVRRWMIISQAQKERVKAEDLALRFGVSEATVYALTSRYNRFGEKGIETPGKGQRQRAYLTTEEESDFLAPFFERAEKGALVTSKNIHAELEGVVGQKIHITTVYRLLKRHNWRKIMPRPSHVKSDKEKQESFKKTSITRSKKC
jgi:transposase